MQPPSFHAADGVVMPVDPGTGTSPDSSGTIPPLASCFVPRPETGPGPLDARPTGQWLVLTPPSLGALAPAGTRPAGTGKTQLAAPLARSWWHGSQGGLLACVQAP